MRDNFLVYVGCGLTDAPQEFIDQVQELKRCLGEVSHVQVLDFVGQGDTDPAITRQKDLEQVSVSDVMIAICEYGSTGLGIEIERANALDKKIIACASNADRSDLVLGIERSDFQFFEYEEIFDVVDRVKEWVEWQSRPEHDKENESYYEYLYRLAITNREVYHEKREQIEDMQEGQIQYQALKRFVSVEEELT